MSPFVAKTGHAVSAALGLAVAAGVQLASAQTAPASAGDAARGARLFLQCRACHTVGASDTNGVGPNLWGVVGAKAGTKPGFHYSAALVSSGVVWTPAVLDRWLIRPTAVVPGTAMAFQGVPSSDARRDIVAYLATLKSDVRAPGR